MTPQQLCPQCNAQFRLRKKNSIEFKRKKEETERIKEIKTGNFWLNVAVVSAVLVGLLVVGLITLSMLSGVPGGAPKNPKSSLSPMPDVYLRSR